MKSLFFKLNNFKKWIVKKTSITLSLDSIFDEIVYAISNFGRGLKSHEDIPEDKKNIFDNQPYTGASSIFEVACYTYFSLDVWLFVNKRYLRNKFSTYFYTRFVYLFAKALDKDENYIQTLMDERVGKYGELTQNNADVKEIYSFLAELIYRSRYNNLPNLVDFDNFVLTNLDIFETLPIKNAVANYEIYVMPVMVKKIEEFIQMNES